MTRASGFRQLQYIVLTLTLTGVLSACALGQETSATVTPVSTRVEAASTPDKTTTKAAAPASAGSTNFFKSVLQDQKEFIKSPFSLKRSDAKWLVPLATATAVLIATDQRTLDGLTSEKDPFGHSAKISSFGSPYATFGAAGTMVALGVLIKDDRLRETGVLGLEALVDSSIVGVAMKAATQRRRPNQGNGFWKGGNAFPSGHTMTTFALATVVAHQYHDKPLVQIAAYGIAGLVGVSRLTARSHYASDVFVGASLGYLIGRYVVRTHSRTDGRPAPSISPYADNRTRTYGVGVSMQF
ncbi:MAG TPA: phosphatase PAP2 family protein [Blastocatellia bacterium]|nr:phosphatase PAP2 family protein [Blastocatellia bacterium]